MTLWLSLAGTPLCASEPLVLNPDDPLGATHGPDVYTFTVGYAFTVGNSSLSAVTLGVRDWIGNGTLDFHDVGLWDSDQNLLASVMISPGASSNGWRFASLTTPVLLSAGESYVLGATWNGSDPIGISRTFEGAAPTYNPTVTFDTVLYDDSLTGLTFPTLQEGPAYLGEFGPNMEFEIVSTPEPSVCLLFLSGLILIVAYRSSRSPNKSLQTTAATSSVAIDL